VRELVARERTIGTRLHAREVGGRELRRGEPSPSRLNTRPKYVVSSALTEPLEWQNSTVLKDDVAEAVQALKQQDGGDLLVVGSTQLVQTLVENDLVDELQVMIDPLIVGGGKRIFLPTARPDRSSWSTAG
jgi:dihydrofolate reductase